MGGKVTFSQPHHIAREGASPPRADESERPAFKELFGGGMKSPSTEYWDPRVHVQGGNIEFPHKIPPPPPPHRNAGGKRLPGTHDVSASLFSPHTHTEITDELRKEK